MRTGDPRRWRLGGWRGRGKQRAGWWKGSDGQWYPPEAARHPAARDEPAAPRRSPPRRLALVGSVWLAAMVPLTLLLAVLLGGLGDTTPTDVVETLGPRDRQDGEVQGDDQPAGGEPSTSVSASLDSEAVEAAVPGGGGTAGRTGTSSEPTDPGDPSDPGDPGTPAERVGPDDPADPDGPPPEPGPVPGSPTPTSGPDPSPSTPAVPRSRDDCKDGGWEHLVDHGGRPFENQGRCVAYVSGG